MDWSYELLSAEERRVLGELCGVRRHLRPGASGAGVRRRDQLAALELIDRLAGKSLVAAESVGDGTRYRLLDTVRHYAADRLAEVGGVEAARSGTPPRSSAWPSGNASRRCWCMSRTTSARRWNGP